jgi:hypothetical protein
VCGCVLFGFIKKALCVGVFYLVLLKKHCVWVCFIWFYLVLLLQPFYYNRFIKKALCVGVFYLVLFGFIITTVLLQPFYYNRFITTVLLQPFYYTHTTHHTHHTPHTPHHNSFCFLNDSCRFDSKGFAFSTIHADSIPRGKKRDRFTTIHTISIRFTTIQTPLFLHIHTHTYTAQSHLKLFCSLRLLIYVLNIDPVKFYLL